MSVNRDTDEGSTLANGGYHDDLNNSLVFRNDISTAEVKETQADSPFNNHTHANNNNGIQFDEGVTQDDDNIETTFLENEKSDHFFDNLPKYNITTIPPPSSNEANHIDTSNILQDVPTSPVNVLQGVKDISLLTADTQVIPKRNSILNSKEEGDSDVISHIQLDLVDTQVIRPITSTNEQADTQVIRPITSTNDQADTQIIQSKERVIFSSDETGAITTSTSTKSTDFRTPLKPTPNQDDTDMIDTSNIDESTIIGPDEEVKATLVQVPSTIERVTSHRQVPNTQDSNVTYLEDVGNSTEISILEVSKFVDEADVEVNSDIEKDPEADVDIKVEEEEEEEEPSITYLENPYEDSLLTNKLKRRKLVGGDDKRSSSLDKVFLTDTKSISESSSSKVIESSIFNNTSSSPVKILKRRAKSLNGSIDLKVPGINNSFDDISSEIEDIDIEEDIKDESSRQDVTTKRRRKNLIVDSQSQPSNADDDHEVIGPLRIEESEVLTEQNIKHRDSVWASFNLKMYPGKLVAPWSEVSQIQFDEGIYDIKNYDLHLLDIRIGDLIRTKANIATDYIVTGLSYDQSVTGITCIRGYNVVHAKKLKGKAKAKDIEHSFLLSECVMEVSDWIHHQSNFQLIFEDQDMLEDTDEKKSIIMTKTFDDQPKSKMSSPVTSTRTSPHKNSIIIDVDKLFSHMVFSITSIEGERKDKLFDLIVKNGGKVVNDGFHELVSYAPNSTSLISKGLYEYKFAAMISNGFCRSAKYLQALALGWPIVSDSFITDCIHDPHKLTQWPIYLLPAGKSSFLHATKSLDTYNFRLNYDQGLHLDKQLENNNNLLQDTSIIYFINNKSNETLDTSKFVFYAFGVKQIIYCNKADDVMPEVQKLTKADEGKIMIYDDSRAITSILQKVSPTSSATRTKSKVGQKLQNTQLGKPTVKVINWEWVVQCVISSYIWEAPTFVINI
ncbi:fungal Rad9-like Rad53-binding-domain-containing protein [Scheffersomyces coipomensis]|uniref:fungal Rad9-like Rad53-binding-domain-containing protein n=1 Tax=Scheffersomyces coipomensis TaxID=1788519 RepID=UPI00315C8E16